MSTIAKEDIYESDGAAPQPQENDAERAISTHPDIELVAVDIDDVMKKFKGRVLNLTSMDYSDSIAKKRRHAFGNNQYVLEVAGLGYSGHETDAEKMNRILYEIADLNAKLKSDASKQTDLLNSEILDSVASEVKTMQEQLSSGKSSHAAYDVETPVVRTDSRVVTLEARLRKIEQAIGGNVIPSAPLLDTLDDLKLRCESLTPSYVAGAEQRLNALLTKLDKVEEARANNAIDDGFEKKVDEILELMQKWDVAVSSLPSSVNKVKALNRLHEQAKHVVSGYAHLKTIKDKLEKEVAQGRETMIEYEANGKQEVASLVEMLKKLEAQVAELKAA